MVGQKFEPTYQQSAPVCLSSQLQSFLRILYYISAMSSATMNATAGPSSPPAAVVHDSPSSSLQIDPFDSFFGYTLSQSSTRDSQHDEYRPSSRFSDISDITPPSYVEPPEYQSRQTEPVTLAMFLFKFGFRTSFVRSWY